MLGFRDWYNDQPYKGERLAFNAWNTAQRRTALVCLQILHDAIWNKEGTLASAREAIKAKFDIEE